MTRFHGMQQRAGFAGRVLKPTPVPEESNAFCVFGLKTLCTS